MPQNWPQWYTTSGTTTNYIPVNTQYYTTAASTQTIWQNWNVTTTGSYQVPITYSDDGRSHRVRIGGAVDLGVEDFVALAGEDPVQLTGVFHPSNTTLTVAPTREVKLSTFGIDWGREGQSGFSAPFSWAG